MNMRKPHGLCEPRKRALGMFFLCASLLLSGAAEVPLRESEHGLLHIRLDLGGVRRWQEGRPSSEPLTSQKSLLVVHLFSLDCPPCLAELPELKPVFRPGMPDLDFALVLETLDAARIQDFLRKSASQLPSVGLYLSTDHRIRATSQLGMEAVPVTLLLDGQHVVRQAFVGSLKDRMHELQAALTYLVPALKDRPPKLDEAVQSSQKLQAERLLHHGMRVAELKPESDTQHVGPRNRSQPAKLQVLYLFGEDCKECTADLEGRLHRLVQGWAGVNDVRFLLLNCGGTPEPSPQAGEWSAGLLYFCPEGRLQDMWMEQRRPITLLVDSHDTVRDVFIGPVGSSVGAALQRLLAGPR
jgi:hypothetical protein